jgi:membrane-bound ClpP family serine protease
MSPRSASATIGLVLVVAVLLATTACTREAAPAPLPVVAAPVAEVEPPENGAISVAPVAPEPPPASAGKKPAVVPRIDWSTIALESGQAWLACDLDYSRSGDGVPLLGLDRESIELLLAACTDHGVLRLRYRGRIAADFAALVQRVAHVAEALEIDKRVLDLDSAGGQVEDAIRAGDVIADSRWTIWVREDSRCHSACVFVLSAGDVRRIAGRVGIHRIIRMSSTATTRAELNAELQLVHQRVRSYLERNGANVAVADLMMAVPNRSLRLLTDDELLRFGLDGVNPAQDDLDRLRLQRECGKDFVSRRDAFARAFDRQCRERVSELDQLNACGLALRRKFGFPDSDCPAESPLSEFDLAQADPEPVDDAAGSPATPAGELAGEAINTAPQSEPMPASD